MARPKKNRVQLSDADVKQLKGIIKKKDTNQTTANRCRVLLALDENHPPAMSYDQLQLSQRLDYRKAYTFASVVAAVITLVYLSARKALKTSLSEHPYLENLSTFSAPFP